jgi:hypothetical protein
MGFTHYNRRPLGKDHDQETWDKFIGNCKLLYKNMPEHSKSARAYYEGKPLILNGCFRYKNPVFNKDRVHFNGGSSKKRIKEQDGKGRAEWKDVDIKEGSEDLGHETFCLQRKAPKKEKWQRDDKYFFSCCKTARKPYDLMVTACLILYKYYFPYVQVSSDGNESEWQQAWEFVACALPHGPEIITEMKLSNNLFEKLFV